MKRTLFTSLLILTSSLAALRSTTADELYTSPKGGAQDAILDRLAKAENEILVFSYAFDSRPLCDALIDATHRGVAVRLLVDRTQSKMRKAKTADLRNGCTQTLQAKTSGCQHAKTMILDRKTIITGSYNWTDAAENANVEHLWIIDNPDLATSAAQHWERCAQKATPVPPPVVATPSADACTNCTHQPTNPFFRRRVLPWSN